MSPVAKKLKKFGFRYIPSRKFNVPNRLFRRVKETCFQRKICFNRPKKTSLLGFLPKDHHLRGSRADVFGADDSSLFAKKKLASENPTGCSMMLEGEKYLQTEAEHNMGPQQCPP